MKIKLFIVWVNFIIFYQSKALEQETFLQANKAYEHTEFQKAHDLYNSIKNKGVATWYNMGNCAYKLGNYNQALVYWNCAKLRAQSIEVNAIDKNIDIVEDKIELKKTQSYMDKLLAWMIHRVNSVSLLVLQLFFLISWFLLFFFIKRYNHGKNYRLLIGILLLINIVLSLALLQKHSQLQLTGMIMKDKTLLFAGPHQQFHILNTLPIASKARIIEQQEQWCKIKHACGYGWILSDSIAII